MPFIRPSRRDVHVDKPLQNLSVAYMQRAENFVAPRVFPLVSVMKQSDVYFEFLRGEMFRRNMKKRPPATRSEGMNYKITADAKYFADVRAVHTMLADEVRENSDDPLDLDRSAGRILALQALLDRELDFTEGFFIDGVWGAKRVGVSAGPVTGTSVLQWNDANSNPIQDIENACNVVHSKTGFRPNKIVLSRNAFSALKNHPDLVSRIDRGQTTNNAQVTKDTMAAIFELEEVLVLDGVVNTANEDATDAIDFIGGNHALLLYTPSAPGIEIPSAGYLFAWTAFNGASSQGTRVRRFREDKKNADMVEIDSAYDHKLVGPDLGFFFEDIVADPVF